MAQAFSRSPLSAELGSLVRVSVTPQNYIEKHTSAAWAYLRG